MIISNAALSTEGSLQRCKMISLSMSLSTNGSHDTPKYVIMYTIFMHKRLEIVLMELNGIGCNFLLLNMLCLQHKL